MNLNLSKTFPGQVALDRFDLVLGAGRTHALVGQNGSGKSTFIKILAGYHQPDAGSVAVLAGRPLQLGDGREVAAAGVRFVHQDLGLVDGLNAVKNIAMGVGYLMRRGGRIDWKANTARAHDGLEALGFHDIDVTIPVGMLAPSQKTAVAVARSMHGWEGHAHLLVLDEPTASLPGADVERLFTAIRVMKDRGVAILYVSHHIKVDRIAWGSLVASAGIAGFAGLIYSWKFATYSNTVGAPLLFTAVGAAFFGASQLKGRPNVWGTIIAVYVLAFGIEGIGLRYPREIDWMQPMFEGLTLIFAVALASRQGAVKVARRRSDPRDSPPTVVAPPADGTESVATVAQGSEPWT